MEQRRSDEAVNRSIFKGGNNATGGYQASGTASAGAAQQNLPVPPELQAEYQKVVAGVEYQKIDFIAEDSAVSPKTQETTI